MPRVQSANGERVRYLDGLRGFAAMQVVMEHYHSAFGQFELPQPFISFAASGDCAVYLFFLMSGTVLTGSFDRTASQPAGNAARRLVRLAGPVLVAVCVAHLLVSLCPGVAARAAILSHSHWLAMMTAAPPAIGQAIVEASGATMLGGYRQTGIFAAVATVMPSLANAVDPPLWSLHTEFWGSALIIALAWARSSAWYAGLIAASVVIIGTHDLNLFLVGHLFSRAMRTRTFQRGVGSPLVDVLGVVLILVGIVMGSAYAMPGFAPSGPLRRWTLLHTYDWSLLQHQVGMVVVFAGVVLSRSAHKLLAHRVLQSVGRLSFPIYLLHWPVMLSVGALAYQVAAPAGASPAEIMALAVGLPVTFGIAAVFERWCDQPCVQASRRVGWRRPTLALHALAPGRLQGE